MKQTEQLNNQQLEVLIQVRNLHFRLDTCKRAENFQLFSTPQYEKLQCDFTQKIDQLVDLGLNLNQILDKMKEISCN